MGSVEWELRDELRPESRIEKARARTGLREHARELLDRLHLAVVRRVHHHEHRAEQRAPAAQLACEANEHTNGSLGSSGRKSSSQIGSTSTSPS